MQKIKYSCISAASSLATLLYPCLFMYFVNASVANFKDIIPITGLSIAISAVVFALLFLLMRSVAKAAMVLNLILLLFFNFKFIEQGLQLISLRIMYWHVLYICLVLVGIGIYLTNKLQSENTAKKINMLALLVFSALILVNLITAAPTIATKYGSEASAGGTSEPITSTALVNDNIYLFIFDEYGGYECLLRYCDYDNTEFYDSLQSRKFNISPSSRSQGISTHYVVPGLMNMDYIVKEDMTINQKMALLKNPFIYRYLREKGYAINAVDAHDFLDTDVDYVFEPDFVSKEGSAEYYIIQNTAYYPFYAYTSSSEIDSLNKQFEYAAQSYKIKDTGLFTVGYFKVPHLPWFVNADGQPQSFEDRYNWHNTNAYVEQLKYTNKKIMEVVDTLLQNDPECSIILMADHGYRLPAHLENWYGEEVDDMNTEMDYMKNVLNVVYVNGEKLDIDGESIVNTLRLVMNHMFGDNLQLVYES